MASPRSSSSSGDYSAHQETHSKSWSNSLAGCFSKEQDRVEESSSPLLPRWQAEQYHETRKSRAPRLFRVHLGWLVATALFVLLMLQCSTGWKEQLQRISPTIPANTNSHAPEATKVSGVTIVSAFFLVANGKKHTSDGEHLELTSTPILR